MGKCRLVLDVGGVYTCGRRRKTTALRIDLCRVHGVYSLVRIPLESIACMESIDLCIYPRVRNLGLCMARIHLCLFSMHLCVYVESVSGEGATWTAFAAAVSPHTNICAPSASCRDQHLQTTTPPPFASPNSPMEQKKVRSVGTTKIKTECVQ